MLWQLHWQYKDGTTDMKAQQDVSSTDKMRTFIKETMEHYSLPPAVNWIACNEKSKHFVYMEAN